jgi:hypothetical protein
MYPLVYEPIGQSFFYDTECPVMPRYIEQLQSNHSEASRHLRHVKKTIKALSQVDLDFLARNYAVDQDYFAIEPLPNA